MSVILVDLADDKHDVQMNWWNWRPILAFLRDAELINDEQFERMGANGCGGQLTRTEATEAAAFLSREILPRIKEDERMHANKEVSSVPQESRPISDLTSHELYAARKSCIESFVSFCETSGRFKVYQRPFGGPSATFWATPNLVPCTLWETRTLHPS